MGSSRGRERALIWGVGVVVVDNWSGEWIWLGIRDGNIVGCGHVESSECVVWKRMMRD